jgi:hypothetical protein
VQHVHVQPGIQHPNVLPSCPHVLPHVCTAPLPCTQVSLYQRFRLEEDYLQQIADGLPGMVTVKQVGVTHMRHTHASRSSTQLSSLHCIDIITRRGLRAWHTCWLAACRFCILFHLPCTTTCPTWRVHHTSSTSPVVDCVSTNRPTAC